jgi:hypothetical protein
MASSGMWRRVELVCTDVSEVAAHNLQWFLAPEFSTLKMEAILSSKTSVHTRSTRRHIPEHGILDGDIVCKFKRHL